MEYRTAAVNEQGPDPVIPSETRDLVWEWLEPIRTRSLASLGMTATGASISPLAASRSADDPGHQLGDVPSGEPPAGQVREHAPAPDLPR